MYCRVGNYSIKEVFNYVLDIEPTKSSKRKYTHQLFHDFRVKPISLRYALFKTKGIVCIKCGLIADHFGLEAFKDSLENVQPTYHFNLYGTLNGREILFTKDHIHPKSKGGQDTLDNLQVMCEPCNTKKGAIIEPMN